MAKVNYSNTSPYYTTPQTVWYMGVYNPRVLEPDGTDKAYVIPAKFNKRPDLAANLLFDNSEYWWVFAILNPNEIIDPINDFIAGLEIQIPTKERVRSIK